jgi:hypothetical protein
MLVWSCQNVYRKHWCRVNFIIAAPVIVMLLVAIGLTPEMICLECSKPIYLIDVKAMQVDEGSPRLKTWRWSETAVFLGGGTSEILIYDDSVVLPISELIRESNRSQQDYGSREWALLRSFGDEIFIKGFIHYLENFLSQKGHRTIGPCGAEWFKIQGSDKGPISNWSERHIAYVAGLGTFSINDGFITEKGIAIRLISVVTELKLAPDSRTAKQHTENARICAVPA